MFPNTGTRIYVYTRRVCFFLDTKCIIATVCHKPHDRVDQPHRWVQFRPLRNTYLQVSNNAVSTRCSAATPQTPVCVASAAAMYSITVKQIGYQACRLRERESLVRRFLTSFSSDTTRPIPCLLLSHTTFPMLSLPPVNAHTISRQTSSSTCRRTTARHTQNG